MYRLDKKNKYPIPLAPFARSGPQVYGGTLPARVWTDYMKGILEGTPVEDFRLPRTAARR
jgi:membrane carboxypeptidase/penicillin-binding protein